MVVEQIKLAEILLCSVVFGILIGVVYDVFRIRRRYFSVTKKENASKKWRKLAENVIVFFEDILFSLICSVLFCILLFYLNSGRFRGLTVVGMFFGFAVYYNTLGRAVMYFAGTVIAFLRKAAGVIIGIIVKPILKLVIYILDAAIGRWSRMVYTLISKAYWLKKAESGFMIIGYKGKIGNEKKVKYIHEGGGRGVHSVLRRNHNSDAI